MADGNPGPYLKYALFCQDTEEGPGDDLVLKGIIDLIELPMPDEGREPDQPVLAEVDLHLAFCIAAAAPGPHYLLVAIKAPGIPLDPPRGGPLNASIGRKESCSSDGSRCFASRFRHRAVMLRLSCWTEPPWAKPAFLSALRPRHDAPS